MLLQSDNSFVEDVAVSVKREGSSIPHQYMQVSMRYMAGGTFQAWVTRAIDWLQYVPRPPMQELPFLPPLPTLPTLPPLPRQQDMGMVLLCSPEKADTFQAMETEGIDPVLDMVLSPGQGQLVYTSMLQSPPSFMR